MPVVTFGDNRVPVYDTYVFSVISRTNIALVLETRSNGKRRRTRFFVLTEEQ